jgi:hypothetical protein
VSRRSRCFDAAPAEHGVLEWITSEWVRFSMWDVAGNGAFRPPQWIQEVAQDFTPVFGWRGVLALPLFTAARSPTDL